MNTTDKIRKMVNRRIVWVKPTDLDANRIRFNWGYHDGALDVRTGFERKDDLDQHYDQVYVRGYRAGQADMRNAVYFEDSTVAWEASGIEQGIRHRAISIRAIGRSSARPTTGPQREKETTE